SQITEGEEIGGHAGGSFGKLEFPASPIAKEQTARDRTAKSSREKRRRRCCRQARISRRNDHSGGVHLGRGYSSTGNCGSGCPGGDICIRSCRRGEVKMDA